MAGSLRYYVYTADDNELFAILADEGNIAAVNGAVEASSQWTDGDPIYKLPINLKPRQKVYTSQNGARSLKVIALTLAAYNASVAGFVDPLGDGTDTLTLTQKIPERIVPLPRPGDSGITGEVGTVA